MPRSLPIPMTTDMVRAVLDGTKTQTRRPVKQPNGFGEMATIIHADYHSIFGPDAWIASNGTVPPYTQTAIKPPYWKGDTLWVREPARVMDVRDFGDGEPMQLTIEYAADQSVRTLDVPSRLSEEWEMKYSDKIRRVPRWVSQKQGIPNGVFMEAARIFLPVKSIRVERLREITASSLIDEGFGRDIEGTQYVGRDELSAFSALWDSIYSKRGLGWAENPYVWVIGWDKPEVKHG